MPVCCCCVVSSTVERSAWTRIRSENWWLIVVLKIEVDKNVWGEETTCPFTCEKHQLYLQRQDSNMRKAVVAHLQWHIKLKRVKITGTCHLSSLAHAY